MSANEAKRTPHPSHGRHEPEVIPGIDLGTTNSLIALCDERGPRILGDRNDAGVMPSVVRLTAQTPIVGKAARDHAVEFPGETISSIKRLMGRSFDDVQDDLDFLTFPVVPGERGLASVQGPNRTFTPQEVSAFILRELKQRAERELGHEVSRAVVTVPAYFDDAQRQATRDAGRLAGLDVVRIVNEPTAAALAYGIGRRIADDPEHIAVYDLGGGTFDISILRVVPPGQQGGESFFQVISTAGDTHLGGDDVDRMLIDLVLSEIRDRFGMALDFPPATRQALRLFVEAAKLRLSEEESAPLQIDLGNGLDNGLGDGRVYERIITRDELNAMITPWVERTLAACQRALRDAALEPAEIDRVVLVGGSTRIPLVRREVGRFFQCRPYTALDPDRVVALGAAVQASILAGANRDMLLLDVIPLSLGIETVGGAVAKLITRNTSIPARATEMFSTSVDGQTNVKVHILQGERELVKDCRSLGEFDLRGIPPMPAGIPQIEVEFLVDANGILNVTAGERRSGKRASIQILPRYGLTQDDVERIERESFTHAREDMHAHRVIDLAVNARLDVKWIREALERVRTELDDDYRDDLLQRIDDVEALIEQANSTPDQVDADAFHAAKEELAHRSMRLHEVAIARSLREDSST